MAAIDEVKEEIGWMKVVFALLVAIDVSLMGWVAQNMDSAGHVLLAIALILVALVIWAIVVINVRAFRMIKQLGDL